MKFQAQRAKQLRLLFRKKVRGSKVSVDKLPNSNNFTNDVFLSLLFINSVGSFRCVIAIFIQKLRKAHVIHFSLASCLEGLGISLLVYFIKSKQVMTMAFCFLSHIFD